jgi:hypothetical protein
MSEIRNSSLFWKITVLIMVVLCVNSAVALDGSGTQQDPWRIQSLEDFNDFAADANYWDDYTRLETDVNLAGIVYERAVIAWDTDNSNKDFDGTSFTGVFDGNGYKIMNLTVNGDRTGNDFVGLFGYINGGQVRNLGIEGGLVSGDRRVGGLVGSGSSITNCYSTCDAIGNIAVGGLVGVNEYGSISNCHSTGDVSGNGGGLVGYNYHGIISNCYSIGSVSGADGGGGLVGYNHYGSISNCYSIGSVSATWYAGGLVGGNERGSISDCNSSGDVSGELGGGLVGVNGMLGWDAIIRNCHSTGDVIAVRAGGLVGENLHGGIVSNCYSTGSVNGELLAGGLTGGNNQDSSVLNCYSTGDVNGVKHVGGLVGYHFSGSITNCYSIGSVNGQDFVGGLIGLNSDIVSNCFWNTDTQTHGIADSFGENKGTVTNVEGLQTAEMKIRSTFTSAGWDFVRETANGTEDIWTINDTVNYPKFLC